MFKKIIVGALLVGVIGVLIAGAAIRTDAKSGNGTTSEAGGGRATGSAAAVANNGGRGGFGQGGVEAQALGRQGNGTLNSVPQADVQPAEWLTIQGNVVSVAADLVEIKIAAGDAIPLEGRPLSYALEQGFSLEVEDTVMLEGFDEDGEFKIGKVTNLSDNSSVVLRNVNGQPNWAGRGRRG